MHARMQMQLKMADVYADAIPDANAYADADVGAYV